MPLWIRPRYLPHARAFFVLNLELLEVLRDHLDASEVEHTNFWMFHHKHCEATDAEGNAVAQLPSTTLGIIPLDFNDQLEDPESPGHSLAYSRHRKHSNLPDSPRNRRALEGGADGGASPIQYGNDPRSALVFRTMGVLHSSLALHVPPGSEYERTVNMREDRASIDFRVLSVRQGALQKALREFVKRILLRYAQVGLLHATVHCGGERFACVWTGQWHWPRWCGPPSQIPNVGLTASTPGRCRDSSGARRSIPAQIP